MSRCSRPLLAVTLLVPSVAAAAWSDAVLADRPVAWFRFEEDRGDIAKSAVGQVEGRYRNVVPAQTSAAPALGRASAFSPKPSQPANIDIPVPLPAGDFTIEWWQLDESTAANRPILTWSDGDGPSFEISVRDEPPDPKNRKKPIFAHCHAGASRSASFAYCGKWFHIVLVRNAANGTIQWFINGQIDGKPTKAATPALPRSAKLRVGGEAFRGALDELAVYETALAADRVLAHYRAALSSLPDREKIVTVGHRGNNQFAPENTRISYVQAVDSGTPVVEMDLRLTSDGEIILMHDDTVNRTTNARGKIAQFTAEQIQKLDAGSWKDPKYRGESVPRLEQITDVCRGKAIMMLDLKATGLGEKLAQWLSTTKFPKDKVILAPWTDEEGEALRRHLPDLPMIRLSGKVPVETVDDAYFTKMKAIGFSGFSIDWRFLPQSFVEAAHRHGMNVYTWTVNAPPEVSGAVLAGVDGIVTDDPAAVMRLVSSLAAK